MNAAPALKQSIAFEASLKTETAVRPLERHDIPRVAALFLKIFRNRSEAPSTALMDYLDQLYLGCPWHDPECGSRVHVDKNGVVDGFLGVVELNLAWENRILRAGVMGGFMVENRLENRGVGLALLRDFLSSPLDVFFSDTANLISLSIAQKLRFQILQAHSLEWVKVLRPSEFAVHMLSRRWPKMPLRPLTVLGRGVDATAGRRFRNCTIDRVSLEGTETRVLLDAEFGAFAVTLLERYSLKPHWNAQELAWLLAQARLKQKNGSLHLKAVFQKTGDLAGIYAFYGQQGGIAQVLNLLPQPMMQDVVVRSLLHDVEALQCVAVRGQAHPLYNEALYRAPGVFYRHNGAMVVRTPHESVAAAIREGKAFFGGLTGEGWTRLVSDPF